MDIRLSGIFKSFDDNHQKRVIFDDMAALFPSGGISVIIGRSGAGKSSLLNLISGIDLPDKGEVHVGPHRLSAMTDTGRTVFRRRHMGFVYQSFNLIPVLTVMENITLVPELDGVKKAVYQDTAVRLLKKTGLYDRRNDFPDRLSGGEQQRVAIVRALVNRPEIILADEPTGNLDLETGKMVLDLIATLAREEGRTLVMVTHSPDAVAYADRVWTVRECRLTADPHPGVRP